MSTITTMVSGSRRIDLIPIPPPAPRAGRWPGPPQPCAAGPDWLCHNLHYGILRGCNRNRQRRTLITANLELGAGARQSKMSCWMAGEHQQRRPNARAPARPMQRGSRYCNGRIANRPHGITTSSHTQVPARAELLRRSSFALVVLELL